MKLINKTILLILIIAGILVTIWFKDGYIMGVGEDGLIFYRLEAYLHQSESTWMQYPGLGSPSLTLVAGKPLFLFLSILQNSGIPGFLIQAIVFYFLIVSAEIGIYLLVKELFPQLPKKFILLSILFYLFNPITVADVWNRFLLNYIFFFSLLPLSTFFYIKGLKTKKFFWLFILNFSLLFYSYAFSYVAFTLLHIIWLFILTVYLFLIDKVKPDFYFKYFFLNCILFVSANSWWVFPVFNLNASGGTTPIANIFTGQSNIGVLEGLSKKLGNLSDILSFTNASFVEKEALEWIHLFYSPIIRILLFSFFFVILFTFIKFRKDKSTLFLMGLLVTVIFLLKGSNPPFGEIFTLFFKKILILQIFRNSFEKFGFLYALVSSILVGISIYRFNFNNNLSRIIYPASLVALLILGFPLFSGLVFTNRFPPADDYSIGYKVKVPLYYGELYQWKTSQGNNFRYIGFPLKEEGITYKWEKGYAGVELAVALFDSKGIFHNTSTPFFNKIVPEIEKDLLSKKDFSKFANLINAKYYILRKDIDYKLRDMSDPRVLEQVLLDKEKNGEVKKISEFGKISIWENLKWKDNIFYSAKKIIKVDSYDNTNKFTDIDVLAGEVLIDKDGLLKLAGKNIEDIDVNLTINYQKINSTRYILHIKNSTNPFLLTFSELYNDGWQAEYTDGQKINTHFRVNVFGNAWIIDRKGDLELEVNFLPQKWLDRGEVISIAAYLGIVGYLVYRYLNSRKLK